jgi:adenylate cyclase
LEVTTLYCNLQNGLLFSSRNANTLLEGYNEANTLLSSLSSAISDREGVLVGSRSDAILGVWGWPNAHDRQVELAAKAALSIQHRLSGMSLAYRCGLALTHGRVVGGQLNASDPPIVDVYGPNVNLALLLEVMTKAFGVSIIVTQEVAAQIATADPQGREMGTRPLGKVRVKGFPHPLWIHELFSASSPSIQDWQREDWSAGVEMFTAGQWADAYEALNTQFSGDTAAHCLIRVMDKTKRKPPEHWDGSFAPPLPSE